MYTVHTCTSSSLFPKAVTDQCRSQEQIVLNGCLVGGLVAKVKDIVSLLIPCKLPDLFNFAKEILKRLGTSLGYSSKISGQFGYGVFREPLCSVSVFEIYA